MVVDNDFNSGGMHFQAFTERTTFAHEYAAALAQGAINRLHDAGLAFAFGAGSVLVAGQHLGVGFPFGRKVPATSAIAREQVLPAAARRGFAPTAQRPGHDAAAGPFNGQPEPDFTLFAAHKGPQLIQFEYFPALFLRLFRAQTWQWRATGLGFFLSVWQCSCAKRPWRARCCVGSCARPAACLPAHTARPWPRQRAQTAPGNGRLYIDSGRGPDYGHCAEFGRCHIWRRCVAYKP